MKTVVFVNDSLRPDHVGCYGYQQPTTPNLDDVASEGYRFTNAYAQATWTVPSSGSILTSVYPLTHGSFSFEKPIRSDLPTIASKLSEAGVKTACISSIITISEQRGYHVGFDEMHPIYDEHLPTRPDAAEHVSNAACSWLDKNHEEDFFLFVWSFGTHLPFSTPDGYNPIFSDDQQSGDTETISHAPQEDADGVKSLYDDTIRYADAQFGRIISKLKELGIFDDICLITTSDHGEIFEEHARFEKSYLQPIFKYLPRHTATRKMSANKPAAYTGHYDILPYDELLHVPLIVKPPGGVEEPEVVSEQVELIDIGPTVLDCEGVEAELGQGKSLIPLMNREGEGRRYTFSTSSSRHGNHLFHSVSDGTEKYIRIETNPNSRDWKNQAVGVFYRAMTPKEFVLDIEEGERSIVSDPGTLTDFRAVYEEWISQQTDWKPNDRNIQLTSETTKQLEDLGYH